MNPNTLVIVNPFAGGGRALWAEPLVASYLAGRGRSVQFVHSRGSGDVRELAAKAGASRYCCVVETARCRVNRWRNSESFST